MSKIIESRNKREGRYAGWRVTGGRNSLNWQGRSIRHERTGMKGMFSLMGWMRALKGGHA